MPQALVVEAGPEVASFVIAAFEHLGIGAFSVESYTDATEILETTDDIVALFINVTDGGNAEALALIAQVAKRWPAIKIILSSARLEQLRELPSCLFLTKPWHPKALMPAIKLLMIAYFRRRRAHRTSQPLPTGSQNSAGARRRAH